MSYLDAVRYRRWSMVLVVAVVCAFSAVWPDAMRAAGQRAAGDLAQTTTIAVRSGNAEAIATCLNLAKAGESANQSNECYNYAYARGGKLIVKNVDVVVGRANDPDGIVSVKSNTVNFTVQGGDATAIATCINQAQSSGDVKQGNPCVNVAIAIGGTVVILDVSVVLVQGE